MDKISIAIYRYLQNHKGILYTVIALSSIVCIFFASKIQFEEDISKLLPSNEIGSSEELVFDDLKVKDKIFVLFKTKNDSVDTEELIVAADNYVENLRTADTDTIVKDILYKLDEDLMFDGMDHLMQALPTFIDSADYTTIDSLLQRDVIDLQMKENLALLQSAEGAYAYDLIRQDPAALRKAFIAKLAEMQNGLGGSYTIIDNHFFTKDSTVLVAFLSPNFKSFDSKTGTQMVEMLEDHIAFSQKTHPGIEILFHGAPVQSVGNSRQIKTDLLLTIGLSLLIACSVIWYFFKNKMTLPVLILPVGFGTLFSLACIYFIQGKMSLMAIGIGAIVLGVALSYSLHIFTHYKYVSEPEKVLKDQTKPIILSSITTIGAFSGLLFTKSALLYDFGLFSSLALVGTTFACIIFVPHFLHPKRNRRRKFHFMDKINAYPFEDKKGLIAAIFVVSALCIYFSGKVEFDRNLVNIGYEAPQTIHSRDILSKKTAQGKKTVYYASTSKDLDTALMYNEMLSKRLEVMQEEGKISSFSRTDALLPSKKSQLADIMMWNDFWTKEKREASLKAISEAGKANGFKSEMFTPFNEMINAQYTPTSLYKADILPNGLMANFVEKTGDTYLTFSSVQMDADDYKVNSDEILTQEHTVVIDPFYYTEDMAQLLKDDFDTVLWISAIFVFIVLIVSFRSISITLLTFFPMVLSWLIVTGVMAITDIQFNLINIIISSFIFGIGVDYSIFIMEGLLAKEHNKEELIIQHKTAIFFSAFVLIVSICSLAFAKHPAISSIGVITLIGMSASLLITFSLQPFFFKILKKTTYFQKVIAKHAA